jgi:hypothetical protein
MTHWDINLQRLLEEVKRHNTRRKKSFGPVEISESGTKIAHGLGLVPDEFNITPTMRNGSAPISWCHYQDPDATYIYIKANAKGTFLVCVAGG